MFIVGMFIRAAIIYYLSKFVVFLFRAMYEHGYQFSYAVKNFYLTAYFFYILLNQQDYCVLLQQAPERSPRKPQSAAHASPRAQPTQAPERSGIIAAIYKLLQAFAIYHAIMARCRQFITKWLQIRFVQNVETLID